MAEETILVIEDDADIRELIRYHLIRDGYSVLESSNGDDGLTKATSAEADLIPSFATTRFFADFCIARNVEAQ